MMAITKTSSRLILSITMLSTILSGLTGCSSLSTFGGDIPTVPVNRVPRELLGRERANMQQISISRLRQKTPDVYQLGANDVLGIYIENVLGQPEVAPPVQFPEEANQAPSLGFPIPVREDGTLALPYITPIRVEGMTLTQATDAIKEAYTVKTKILPGGVESTKFIVTLMRRRKYRVTVIREEGGGKEGVTKRGTGNDIDLPAYENDVLRALNQTGGLPGLDAKNEIFVIRGSNQDGAKRDAVVASILAGQCPCSCDPNLPRDPNVTIIPLRFHPENLPRFTEEDIILNDGDIVYIPARDQDRYYTGGLLQGGDNLLPRDYDLDVLAAVSVAGGQIASGGTGIGRGGVGGGGGGGGGGQGSVGKPPSKLIVLRKLKCGGQIPIRIDLNKALIDPQSRILVQPEDTLILKYTIKEELFNAALSLVQFNFLFNNFTGVN